MDREILVSGGGPAGSAIATLLRQRGHDVLLVDEARFPRDKICGESISPMAWPVLDELGATEAVRRCGPRELRGWHVVAPDGSAFRGDYPDALRPGFALRRERLDQVLLETARASGVEVQEATRTTAALVEGGAVTGLVLRDARGAREVRARLVVVADGRRSRVARQLGLLSEDRSFQRFAVRGYWSGMEGLSDRGEMHVAAGAYCGVAPLPGERVNVTFVLPRKEMSAAAGDLDAFYVEALRRWPAIQERLARARLLEPPRAIGPLALKARQLWLPGALLVGDAAGFYDPFTGEGVTLALRSGLLAAEVVHAALQQRGIPDLSGYQRRRRAETRHKFLFNRIVQRLMSRPALANHLVRRIARKPSLAHQLVGIAGDYAPARDALSIPFLWELLVG